MYFTRILAPFLRGQLQARFLKRLRASGQNVTFSYLFCTSYYFALSIDKLKEASFSIHNCFVHICTAIWHSKRRNVRRGLFIFQHQIRKMTSFIYSSYPMTLVIPSTSLQETLLGLHISSCLAFAFFYGIQLKGRKFKAVHW